MIGRAVGLAWMAILVTACGSGAGPDSAPRPDKAPPAVAPAVIDQRLLGQEWRLESMGAVGDERPLLNGTSITLTFNADGTLDGFGGCNTYRTTYRSGSAGELAVRALIRTTRACSDSVDRQETTYLDVLHRVESYEVHEDRLLLFYESGGRDLVYRGAASAGAGAPGRPAAGTPDRPAAQPPVRPDPSSGPAETE